MQFACWQPSPAHHHGGTAPHLAPRVRTSLWYTGIVKCWCVATQLGCDVLAAMRHSLTTLRACLCSEAGNCGPGRAQVGGWAARIGADGRDAGTAHMHSP